MAEKEPHARPSRIGLAADDTLFRQVPGPRTQRPKRLLLGGGLLLACLPLLLVEARAESQTGQFVEGLRQRRLYELAETYCRNELQRSAQQQSNDDEQAELTCELMRTLAAHAANLPAAQRDTRWQDARAAADAFLARKPSVEAAFRVRLQQALLEHSRGEMLLLEAAVAADTAAAMATARDELRHAARQLQSLDAELQQATGSDATWSDDERLSLQHHVQWQWGRALRQLALTYSEGSADRVAMLNEALRQLERPLRQLPDSARLTWELRLEQAECQRLLGQLDASRDTLSELQAQPLNGVLLARRQAEQVRLALAKGDLQEARTALPSTNAASSAELDMAALEILLRAWQEAAPDANRAEQAGEAALAAARAIGQQHGPYWGRRADVALIAAGMAQRSSDVQLLTRTADNLYLQGKLAEALAAYDNAAHAARRAKQHEAAFAASYKAALVVEAQRQYTAAAERFRQLALDLPDHPQAPQAHLQAALHTAEAIRQQAASLDEYSQLLDEHLQRWPESASSVQAALWQGQLHRSRKQWEHAAEQYWRGTASREPDPQLLAQLLREAAACWLAAADAMGDGGRELATAAERRFIELLDSDRSAPLPALPRAVGEVARAELRLVAEGKLAAQDRQRLDQVGEDTELPTAVRQHAQLIAAIAVGLESAAAQPAAPSLDLSLPELARHAYDWLARLARPIEQQLVPATAWSDATANLRLALIRQLEPHAGLLAAPQAAAQLQRWEAEALAGSGQAKPAIELARQLVEAAPQDLATQESLARVLYQDASSEQAALEQWRRMAARTPPRSDAWFRAKYFVAASLLRIGDRSAAAQLIQYLTLTEDLEAAGVARPFEELLSGTP